MIATSTARSRASGGAGVSAGAPSSQADVLSTKSADIAEADELGLEAVEQALGAGLVAEAGVLAAGERRRGRLRPPVVDADHAEVEPVVGVDRSRGVVGEQAG